MFIAYSWDIDSAARCLIAIARCLGEIYFPQEHFEKMEQDTPVWVYILIWNVHFLHTNNANVEASTCYGLMLHI